MSDHDKCCEIVQGRAVGCAGGWWREPHWENAGWAKTWKRRVRVSLTEKMLVEQRHERGEWAHDHHRQSPGRGGSRCKGPEAALRLACPRGEGAAAVSEESHGVGGWQGGLCTVIRLSVKLVYLSSEPDAMSELLSSGWLNLTVLKSHLATVFRFRCRGLRAVAL